MRPPRVAVVGCGTAGPAVALMLHRDGHQVTLLERVARPGPVGAGILLQRLGQEILARIGLAATLRDLSPRRLPVSWRLAAVRTTPSGTRSPRSRRGRSASTWCSPP